MVIHFIRDPEMCSSLLFPIKSCLSIHQNEKTAKCADKQIQIRKRISCLIKTVICELSTPATIIYRKAVKKKNELPV